MKLKDKNGQELKTYLNNHIDSIRASDLEDFRHDTLIEYARAISKKSITCILGFNGKGQYVVKEGNQTYTFDHSADAAIERYKMCLLDE